MPEALLKTAQRSAYVSQANPNLAAVIKPSKGYRLSDYRQKYAINVSRLATQTPQASTINSFLFFKSRQHKKLLDNLEQDKNNRLDLVPLSSQR